TSLSPLVFFYCYGSPPDLHSFPTRRSSDLRAIDRGRKLEDEWNAKLEAYAKAYPELAAEWRQWASGKLPEDWQSAMPAFPANLRSEEHTSELQSLTNLVCRLLLEKKNHSNT